MCKFVDISVLLGRTLRSVTRHGTGSIMFEDVTGKRWKMHHRRDCCEIVYIEDVCGDLSDLEGSPIHLAEVVVDSPCRGTGMNSDSFTWTFYKLATAKGYVTIRWYGTSNGYYSESVDFEALDEDPGRGRDS